MEFGDDSGVSGGASREDEPSAVRIKGRWPWSLAFEGEAEAAFRRHFLLASRTWVRLSVVVALSTVTGFAFIDHLVLGVTHPVPDYVRFGLQLPCVLVVLWATFSRGYEKWYGHVILFVAPLFGLGSIALTVYASPGTEALVGARLLLVTFFIYFMLGLRARQAFTINAFLVLAYAVVGWQHWLPYEVAAYGLFAMITANMIGGAGSFALEQANRLAFREHRRLLHVATHDGLTGLMNRRALEDQLRALWQQAVATATPLSVLMIDLDHFKAYNDHYGHQAGDACLRRVAQAVARALDDVPGALVARYGGEEMIAVLPGARLPEARDAALRVLESVRALGLEHAAVRQGVPGFAVGRVSVSVGAAAHEPPLEGSSERVVRVADRALYTAKRQGRNGAVTARVPNPGEAEASALEQEAALDAAS
jgi:diguanylate cyclase (GGDEF)-like protein